MFVDILFSDWANFIFKLYTKRFVSFDFDLSIFIYL